MKPSFSGRTMNRDVSEQMVNLMMGEVPAPETLLMMWNHARVNYTVSPKQIAHLQDNLNDFFLLINAVIITLMQTGFACLEAGSVHSKNTINIVMKNLMDMFICGVCYYLFGYAIAYGTGSPYVGRTYWLSIGLPDDHLSHWFFQFVFAATAATIISGAVAERCNFAAYLIYSALISGVTYPIVSHWVWYDHGWLQRMGYVDYAGSGAIHAFSGACSFVAAAMLGPRIGRFTNGKPNDMPGHSLPLMGIGALLLVTGFLSFNGGSMGSITGTEQGNSVARAMINTILGGSGAAGLSLFICRLWIGQSAPWPFSLTLNATLTGIVALCASANALQSWVALLVGAIACLVFYALHFAVLYAKVDDPLDATAVHFGGGFTGVILQPIFKRGGFIFTGSLKSLKAVGINLAGGLIIIAWAILTSLIIFGSLRLARILRVSEEDEKRGLDETKHGEISYHPKAWGWEMFNVTTEEDVKIKSDGNSIILKEFENIAFENERQDCRR